MTDKKEKRLFVEIAKKQKRFFVEITKTHGHWISVEIKTQTHFHAAFGSEERAFEASNGFRLFSYSFPQAIKKRYFGYNGLFVKGDPYGATMCYGDFELPEELGEWVSELHFAVAEYNKTFRKSRNNLL